MISFWKVHGIGNDFVLVPSSLLGSRDPGALALRVCDRRLGVGADGLLVVDDQGPARLRMFNPDGSPSGMCGNGLRCVAAWLHQMRDFPTEFMIGLADRQVAARIEPNGWVSIQMGHATFESSAVPFDIQGHEQLIRYPLTVEGRTWDVTAVGIGNPHAVIFDSLSGSAELEHYGALLEHHRAFPQRTNVHFVEVKSREHVIQRTWERGAGITQACGSGACAVVAAGHRLGVLDSVVRVSLPGGDLEIEAGPDDAMRMSGPAVIVFQGEWPD